MLSGKCPSLYRMERNMERVKVYSTIKGHNASENIRFTRTRVGARTLEILAAARCHIQSVTATVGKQRTNIAKEYGLNGGHSSLFFLPPSVQTAFKDLAVATAILDRLRISIQCVDEFGLYNSSRNEAVVL
ncbi:uncharacterized protein V6R79_010216 [Siganus canaliculatus]